VTDHADQPQPEPRPSQQLAALLGLPEPTWSAEEQRAWRDKMRRADQELEAIIARRGRHAA
jgi:hypothetical protein